MEDRDKNLWFGTENGSLYKYNRIKHTKSPSQFNHSIYSIILDHSGYLLLGTNGSGIYRLHLNWQTFLENYSITDIDQDTAGDIWVASSKNGIFRFNGTKFDTIAMNDNMIYADYVNSILIDKHSGIWCATRKGVHCYNPEHKNWTQSYYYPDLAHNTANIIFQDKSGNLWVGTKAGISHFAYNDWITYDTGMVFLR